MARRGRRVRLATAIYEDDSGLAVVVKIAGRSHEERFPHGTPLPDLEAVRDRLQGRARAAQRPKPGTLAGDVVDYLTTIADPAKRRHAAILCGHWTLPHGRLSRFALSPVVIRQQLARWRQTAAASTCNHRLAALRAVFTTLNGDADPNPTLKVKKLREPDPEPRALSLAVIERILAAMPDRGKPTGQGRGTRPTVSLSKLRCQVMAYTGLPPAQIARINPATDLHWTAAVLRVRPRRKGRGTTETWLPLLPQAIAALRALQAAQGWGAYSTSSVRQSWHRACVVVIQAQRAAGETPLPHRIETDATGAEHIRPLVRPYDLRHSFGSRALALTGNLAGVQRLLLHADPRQTLRYVQGAVPESAQQVIDALKKVGNT